MHLGIKRAALAGLYDFVAWDAILALEKFFVAVEHRVLLMSPKFLRMTRVNL
jgi:hypothetical protein